MDIRKIFIAQQFDLKVFECEVSVTGCKIKRCDKWCVWWLQDTKKKGDEVLIVNRLTSCCQLICKIFGFFKILETGFGTLSQCLKLMFKMGNAGTRLRRKASLQGSPDLLRCFQSINSGNKFFRKRCKDPSKETNIFLLPNNIDRI